MIQKGRHSRTLPVTVDFGTTFLKNNLAIPIKRFKIVYMLCSCTSISKFVPRGMHKDLVVKWFGITLFIIGLKHSGCPTIGNEINHFILLDTTQQLKLRCGNTFTDMESCS